MHTKTENGFGLGEHQINAKIHFMSANPEFN